VRKANALNYGAERRCRRNPRMRRAQVRAIAAIDSCESAQEPLRAPINDGPGPFRGLVLGLSMELAVSQLTEVLPFPASSILLRSEPRYGQIEDVCVRSRIVMADVGVGQVLVAITHGDGLTLLWKTCTPPPKSMVYMNCEP
jgi:hypothetical protein